MKKVANHIAYSAPATSPDKKTYGIGANIEPTLKYGTIVFSGTDKLGKLCRVLKEGKLTVLDASHAPMYMVDVASRAAKSLVESKTRGFRFNEYVPMPDDVQG